MGFEISEAGIKGLGSIAVFTAVSFIGAKFVNRRLSFGDQLAAFWAIFCFFIHVFYDAAISFIWIRGELVPNSTIFYADIWREYALADFRYGYFDPTTVAIEYITATLDTALALVLAYAIINGKPYRHFVQIVLCTCQLYGTYVYFATEVVQGYPNFVTPSADPLKFWVYLIFLNFLWVVVPLILIAQSGYVLSGLKYPSSKSSAGSNIKPKYNTRSKKNM